MTPPLNGLRKPGDPPTVAIPVHFNGTCMHHSQDSLQCTMVHVIRDSHLSRVVPRGFHVFRLGSATCVASKAEAPGMDKIVDL